MVTILFLSPIVNTTIFQLLYEYHLLWNSPKVWKELEYVAKKESLSVNQSQKDAG